MKIVALYKTLKGGEWIKKSIESIYKHVDKIFLIHSTIDWLGNRTKNNVLPCVCDWVVNNDKENKIFQYTKNCTNGQEGQYNYGLNLIKEYEDYDYIMLIDSDEIWEESDLLRAKEFLEMNNHQFDAIRTRMYTYVKDVHYQIFPIEPCAPVVFVSKNVNKIDGARGNKIENSITMNYVKFHHYTLVRNDEEEIFEKIKLSNFGDGDFPPVDTNSWKTNVWDRLPDVKNFHITKGFGHCWKSVKVLQDSELPSFFKLQKKEDNYAMERNN